METRFGNGRAGENARLIVATEVCKECGQKAVNTVDFDLIGDLEQIPACASVVCIDLIKGKMKREMRRLGQVDQRNTFSFNGLGRY